MNNLLQQLIVTVRQIFKREPPYGFLPDPVDPHVAWYDQIFGATETASFKPSIDWLPDLKLRRQFWWPFCVTYAALHIQELNQRREGFDVRLAAQWLAVKAGTNYQGTSIRNVLEVLRTQGCPPEQECLMANGKPFEPQNIPLTRWAEVFRLPKINESAGLANRISGYARIAERDINSMKAALQHGPLLAAAGIGSNYSSGGVVRNPTRIGTYHCFVIAGYDEKGNFRIGDSLVPQEKILSGDYHMPWIYTILDLPTDWKDRQVNALERAYPRALKERFGQVRNFALEFSEAGLLKKVIEPEVKRDPRLGGIFGKLWTVFVAVVVYGGRTQMECIGWAKHYALTGHELFNLDEPKE